MKLRLPRHFTKSENGSISVEAVFAFPILVIAMTATFVFWDAFKTQNTSQKATYTVADMLSREQSAMDGDYLLAMHALFDFLSREGGDNGIRVSVVTMTEDPDTLVKEMSLVWSKAAGAQKPVADIKEIEARIPAMAVGDQLIVVESYQEWVPKFSVGMAPYTFRETAITRPRFAPKLVWKDSASAGA